MNTDRWTTSHSLGSLTSCQCPARISSMPHLAPRENHRINIGMKKHGIGKQVGFLRFIPSSPPSPCSLLSAPSPSSAGAEAGPPPFRIPLLPALLPVPPPPHPLLPPIRPLRFPLLPAQPPSHLITRSGRRLALVRVCASTPGEAWRRGARKRRGTLAGVAVARPKRKARGAVAGRSCS